MTSLKPRLQLALLRRKARLNGKQPQNLLQKGFTLIELIVVVLIIGILAAIAIPNFLDQATKAKGTECSNKGGTILKQWYALSLDGIVDSNTPAAALATAEGNASQYCSFGVGTLAATSTIALLDAIGEGDISGKYDANGCVNLLTGKVDWVIDIDTSATAASAGTASC